MGTLYTTPTSKYTTLYTTPNFQYTTGGRYILRLTPDILQGDAGATKLAFAPDGMHIAVADTDACVGLYRRERNVLESGKEVNGVRYSVK